MPKELFASNLKYIRSCTLQSQKQFAEDVKINLPNLNAYESKTTSPTIDTLCDIADHVGVTITELWREDLKNRYTKVQMLQNMVKKRK